MTTLTEHAASRTAPQFCWPTADVARLVDAHTGADGDTYVADRLWGVLNERRMAEVAARERLEPAGPRGENARHMILGPWHRAPDVHGRIRWRPAPYPDPRVVRLLALLRDPVFVAEQLSRGAQAVARPDGTLTGDLSIRGRLVDPADPDQLYPTLELDPAGPVAGPPQ